MSMINFDQFKQMDIRVGKIVKVEDHPNADKLFVLTVDFGSEVGERTIVAGLKKFCEAGHIEGETAIFIINLEPATIRGVKSEGMVLAAVNSDDSQGCILKPLDNMEPGNKVR